MRLSAEYSAVAVESVSVNVCKDSRVFNYVLDEYQIRQ